PATSVQHGHYDSDVAVLYKEFLSHQVSWAEFCEVFRAHHIPKALMEIKEIQISEFLNFRPLLKDHLYKAWSGEQIPCSDLAQIREDLLPIG
ncbi:hypothetical protein ACJX0J_034285, partial [Zea mays]